uniref:Uncharacterized protein n=1 Tax=Anopheles albimanus TaxID=7167 RepID=A0A182FYK6_ANOAL
MQTRRRRYLCRINLRCLCSCMVQTAVCFDNGSMLVLTEEYLRTT